MVRLYLTFLFLFFLSSLKAQNFNRPVPSNYAPYEFHKYSMGNSSLFYLLTPIERSRTDYVKHLRLLNSDGYIAWYSSSDSVPVVNFQFHSTHQLFSYGKRGEGLDSKFIILDASFNKIDSILAVNGASNDIHEFLILDNGNYVLAASRDSVMDLSSYSFNGNQGLDSCKVKSFVLQEFDSNHNLLFEWNSIDHIYPTEFIDGYNYNENEFDYVHGNAIEEDADGNFLISFRHIDAIYKINRVTGDVMWILGGKSNQFNFVNDNGFSAQHDIRLLPNGNITLFDNANNTDVPKITRAMEYTLDTVNMTCTRVWEYIHNPPFFARAMGNFQTSVTNEKLIGYGYCLRPNPSFVHLDEFDNIHAELFLKDSVISYRARMASLSFINAPSINCSNSGGQAILTAPAGYSKYEWSTGETTESIIVSDTGTYQVWVNYGVGMLGSEPIFISNIQNPCGTVGIKTMNKTLNDRKQIRYVYDLLGRIIKNPKIGHLYILQYVNGNSELVNWNNIHNSILISSPKY